MTSTHSCMRTCRAFSTSTEFLTPVTCAAPATRPAMTRLRCTSLMTRLAKGCPPVLVLLTPVPPVVPVVLLLMSSTHPWSPATLPELVAWRAVGGRMMCIADWPAMSTPRERVKLGFRMAAGPAWLAISAL